VNVRPFTVDVAQAALDDLRDRLARTRWPGELDGPGWDDGTSPAFLREVIGGRPRPDTVISWCVRGALF
jgi:epoxide hydrolase